MKLTILLSSALLATIGYAQTNTTDNSTSTNTTAATSTPVYVYSTGLADLYGMVCQDNNQSRLMANLTAGGQLFYDNSPFQFITGYALGTQVQANVTDSTCFGQAW